MKHDLDFNKIGKRIQFYRNKNKMTQEQLAECVGTNQKHVSKIELGEIKVKLETAYALAKALNISIDVLVADYNDSNDEANLKLILDDIKGMNAKQLKMLRENISTIKRLNQ